MSKVTGKCEALPRRARAQALASVLSRMQLAREYSVVALAKELLLLVVVSNVEE